MSYEIALRAGIALHTTVCDYHTSGAWNALGCAAITARRLKLNEAQTRHALGIAEYHGPRSQMMRVIDDPTMLKDGSGWGAMAGVSAGMMAHGGFTGAPAITVEAGEVAHLWNDLGERWHITGQYFKPYAVCYWAQSPIAGALKIQTEHGLTPGSICRIRVTTFREAVALDWVKPNTTEEAQYSVPFPVASALMGGNLGPAQLVGEALHNPAILNLAERVELVEDPALSARFPHERVARVTIETTDGRAFDSGEMTPRWDTAAAHSDAALREKFRWLAGAALPPARADELDEMLWTCETLAEVGPLAERLAA
jgi:2-methylcitrate dehydratase PrpD